MPRSCNIPPGTVGVNSMCILRSFLLCIVLAIASPKVIIVSNISVGIGLLFYPLPSVLGKKELNEIFQLFTS